MLQRMADQKLWEEILLKLLGIIRCVTNAKRKIIKYSGFRYLQQGTESHTAGKGMKIITGFPVTSAR